MPVSAGTTTTSRLRTGAGTTTRTTASQGKVITTSARRTPPTAAQLADFTVSAASSSAHRVWVSDLRALWSRADERFADVAWVWEGSPSGSSDSPSPSTSPRTRAKAATEVVYAHRAIVLTRAPKSFQANGWLGLPTVQRSSAGNASTTTRTPTNADPARKVVTKKPPQPPSSFHMKTGKSAAPPSPRKPLERRRLSGNAASSMATSTPAAPAPTSPPLTRRASSAVSYHNLAAADDAATTTLDELSDAVGYLYRAGSCSTTLLSLDNLPTEDEGYDRLSADLLTLWKTRQWTDVTLHVNVAPPSRSGTPTTTVGEDTPTLPSSSSLLVLPPMADAEEEESQGSFAVHKFILVSRCPYFAAQFLGSSTYSDSNAQAVNLPPGPPFTPTALYFTLGFLYTGTLSFSTRTFDLTIAFEIWRVAAYLQVRTLTDLIAATIAQDFCHGFRCHTACQTCAKRVPRTLAFAAGPDVAEGVLYHLALGALTRGEFAVYWAREVGSMDAALRREIVEGVRDTIRSDVSACVGVLRQLMFISSRLDAVRTVKWVENLRSMVEEITETLQTHLVTHFDVLSTSEAFQSLIDGVGLHFDVIERLLSLLITTLSSHTHHAPKIYQSLVGNILLRGEEGLEPGTVRDIVESARRELVQFLSKRWVGIRAQAGFNTLEKWALGEIAGEIDVRKEELLLPDDEGAAPRERKVVSPTVRKAATTTQGERAPGPINLRAAVLNRNAARIGAGTGTTAGSRTAPTARSNGAAATPTRAGTTVTRPAGASATTARSAAAPRPTTTRPATTTTTTTRPTTTSTTRPAATTSRPTPTTSSTPTTARALRTSTSTNQLRATNGVASTSTPARVVRRTRETSNGSTTSAASSSASASSGAKRSTSTQAQSRSTPAATPPARHAISADATNTPVVHQNVSLGDSGAVERGEAVADTATQAEDQPAQAAPPPTPPPADSTSSSPTATSDEMLSPPPPPLPLPTSPRTTPTPSPPPAAHTKPARPVLGTKIAGLAARFSGSSPTSPLAPLPRLDIPLSAPPSSSSPSAYSSASAFAARKRRLSSTPRSRTSSNANVQRATSPLARTLSPSLSTHPVYAAARRKSTSPVPPISDLQYPTRSASVISLAERRATVRRRAEGGSKEGVQFPLVGQGDSVEASTADAEETVDSSISDGPHSVDAQPPATADSVDSTSAHTPPQATHDTNVNTNDTPQDSVDVPITTDAPTDSVDAPITSDAPTDSADVPITIDAPSDTADTADATTTNTTTINSTIDEDGDLTAETTRDLSVESKDTPAESADCGDDELSSSTETELVTHDDDGQPGEVEAEAGQVGQGDDAHDEDGAAIEAGPSLDASPEDAYSEDGTAAEPIATDETAAPAEAETQEQGESEEVTASAEVAVADSTADDDAAVITGEEPTSSADLPTPSIEDEAVDDAPTPRALEDDPLEEASQAAPEEEPADLGDETIVVDDETAVADADGAVPVEADAVSPSQEASVDEEALDMSETAALLADEKTNGSNSEDATIPSLPTRDDVFSSSRKSLMARAPPSRLDTSSEPFPESSGPRTPRAMRTMTLPVESDLTPRPSKFLSDVGDMTITRAARSSPSAASQMPPATSLSVGIPCIIWPAFPGLPPRTRMRAVVKYIGPVDGYAGAMVGVEVPLPLAEAVQACQDQFNDGTVNGKRYFHLGPSWASRHASAAVSGTTTPASGGGSPPSPSTLSLSGGHSRLSIHLDMFARAEREARKRRIARLQASATRVVSAPSGIDAGNGNGSTYGGHIRYNSGVSGNGSNGNTATIRGPRHSGPALSHASARGIFASAPTSPLDELSQPSFHRRRESSSASSLYQQSNASLSTLTGSLESDLDGDGESSVFGMRFSPRAGTGMPAVPQHHSRRPSMLIRSPSILSLSSLHEHSGPTTGKLTRANLRSLSGASSVSSRSPSPSPVLQQFEDESTVDSRRSSRSTTMGPPPPPPSSYNQSLHPFALSSRSRRSSWSPSVAGSVRSASTITSRRNTSSRHGGGTASFMERMEDESTPRLGLFVRPDEVVWIFEDE